MQYKPEIDGLRALAVIPVMLFHAGFQVFSGGFVGVDIFFVISGFLITRIIIEEKERGVFSLKTFYERRARRILPALFLTIMICTPISWFLLLPSEMREYSESIIAATTFTSNVYFWLLTGYFDGAAEIKPLLHTWSLALEEQFYIFFPLLIALTWRNGNRRILAITLCITATACFGLAQWGSIEKPSAAFFLLPTRAWELLLGALIALNPPKYNSTSLNQVASFTGVLFICYSIFAYEKNTPMPGIYALLPTLGASLILLFATPCTTIGKLLANRILVRIGLLSYSAYLWHQPVLALARHATGPNLNHTTSAALLTLTMGLAYLSWNYVENAFRNPLLISRNKFYAFFLGSCLLLLAFGATGISTNGFLFRYNPEDRDLASLNPKEMGKFVMQRFNSLRMAPFDQTDKRSKVLIIGDSFAQDLVNALVEGGLSPRIQISTHFISAGCGSLFIQREKFAQNISPESTHDCINNGLFEDAKLRELMLSADEIWFASAWTPWAAELTKQSYRNLSDFSLKPIKIFGRKNFGRVEMRHLLSLPQAQRLATMSAADTEIVQTHNTLRSLLPSGVFIDVQKMLCDSEGLNCPLFDENGDLISYDGGHLTRTGAIYFGKKLTTIDLVAAP